MRKIGVQLIRLKSLKVSVGYTIRLVKHQRLKGRFATRARFVAEKSLQRQVRSLPSSVDPLESAAVVEDRERVTERTGPIPRLKTKSPKVHAAVASVKSDETHDEGPERQPENVEAPERKPALSVVPASPSKPEAEVPVLQPQKKRRSATPKVKAEPTPPSPPPETRLKVIRRRGEQAPKVFETVTREFPSAMLRGVKMMKDREPENA